MEFTSVISNMLFFIFVMSFINSMLFFLSAYIDFFDGLAYRFDIRHMICIFITYCLFSENFVNSPELFKFIILFYFLGIVGVFIRKGLFLGRK